LSLSYRFYMHNNGFFWLRRKVRLHSLCCKQKISLAHDVIAVKDIPRLCG
jgi:hypothetical protein